MKYSEAGKGSVARKTDKEKFDENFDKIFKKKKEVYISEGQEGSETQNETE